MTMLSDEEWNALPEEEKEKRRQELLAALREAFAGFDKKDVIAAIESTLTELREQSGETTE